MADTTVYACTDEAFGFMKNLVSESMSTLLEVLNGAGVVKSKVQYAIKTRVSGTLVTQGAVTTWTDQIATGTPITIADTDIGGAATVYLESFTLRKGGGENLAAMELDFVGWEWPSLTV